MAHDSTQSLPPEPGVLGDETEEQNLNQPGNPEARITEAEVNAAFKSHQEEVLDHGLEESFPASDPPAVKHVD
jgi:hypothetical protein